MEDKRKNNVEDKNRRTNRPLLTPARRDKRMRKSHRFTN